MGRTVVNDPIARPTASVVIPCRNEAKHIARCIRSVIDNGYPGGVEILVVDGMSDDGTRAILSELQSECPNLRILDNPCRTTPHALNIGIQEARGDVIVIVGAHCWLERGYIEKVASWVLRENDVGCAGGKTVALAESGFLQTLIARVLASPFGVGNSTYRLAGLATKVQDVDTVAYGAYPRRVFARIGLFDERLIRDQDMELNSRLRKASYRILLDPAAIVHYAPRSSLRAFAKQNFANGFWNVLTWYTVPGSLSWRHFIPMLFVTALLGSGVLAVFARETGGLFLTVIGTYALASGLESTRIAFKERCMTLFAVFLVFPVLHISYGLGSLAGALSVLNRLLRKAFWQERTSGHAETGGRTKC